MKSGMPAFPVRTGLNSGSGEVLTDGVFTRLRAVTNAVLASDGLRVLVEMAVVSPNEE